MSKKNIMLFAESPVKVSGKRILHKEFSVDSQEQADALVKCGAASYVSYAEAVESEAPVEPKASDTDAPKAAAETDAPKASDTDAPKAAAKPAAHEATKAAAPKAAAKPAASKASKASKAKADAE